MLRIVLALVYARAFDEGSWWPLIAFALAAAADYVDGPLARRAGGESRYGALLDSAADIVFVLVTTTTGVVAGRLSFAVPVAIAASATPYLVATLRRIRANESAPRAYSMVGHAAGVCNYALVGLLAGSVALPWAGWTLLLAAGSVVVVALNVTAVVQRVTRA